MIAEVEEDLINAFVVKRKRERYLAFLRSPKRRRDFLRQLYHFHDFDPACTVPLVREHQTAEVVLAELYRRGATDSCYAISVESSLDGTTDRLSTVIPRVYAREVGTIISCIPGRLAYYEGELDRFLLNRAPTRRDKARSREKEIEQKWPDSSPW